MFTTRLSLPPNHQRQLFMFQFVNSFASFYYMAFVQV